MRQLARRFTDPAVGTLVVAAILLMPLTADGLLRYDPLGGLAGNWSLAPAILIPLTAHWGPQSIPRTPRFWALSAIMIAMIVTVGLLLDRNPLYVLWLGVANYGIAFFTALLFRAGTGGSWAVTSPRRLIRLLIVCTITSAVGVPFGAYPGTSVFNWTARHQLGWTVHHLVFLFIGAVTGFTMWYWRRPRVVERTHRGQVLAMTLTGFACVAGAFNFPELPLSWVCLGPALWAGMVLSPVPSAWYALLVALAAMPWEMSVSNSLDTTYAIPKVLFIDLLLVFGTFLTLLLVLFRDQRARLVLSLREQQATTRAQAKLLSTSFEAMSDGLILFDAHGRMALHNRAARTLLGRPFPKSPPASWSEYFDLQAPQGHEITVQEQEILHPVGGQVVETVVSVSAGGSESPRMLAITGRAIGEEAHSRTLLLLRDVTSDQERFNQLRAFCGTVAHDLRGPLTSLKGWVETAQDSLAADQPEVRTALDRAALAGERMNMVIEDYLALAVAREGSLRLARVPLGEVVSEITQIVGRAPGCAEGCGDDTVPEFDIDTPHAVHADRVLTRQLMANLIGNSLKYCRPGQPPHITVRSLDDAEPGWVRIAVADRGVGLQPGDEERIFTPFQRSEKDAEQYQGTGLGLALCHSIVTRHGGSIRAQRNPDGGATIEFTLPAAA